MAKKQIIIWTVNLSLVLVAAVLAWIYGPSMVVEAKYQEQVKQQDFGGGAGFSSLMYSMTGFSEILDDKSLMAPIDPNFGLVIPKIFANVSVSQDVNPEVAVQYQAVLRQAGGVAHAAGSSVPGEAGTTYIFGHSTDAGFNVNRYNAVFYLLKKLEPGDEIIAYYKGQDYHYLVTEKKVVEPTDISDITNVANESKLVLQTCWPPGTTWKRLLIIAKPKAD
ncbi:MAG: sortase [Patescibacteria group bacterium]